MALFIDVHKHLQGSKADVEAAHKKDLAVQGRYDTEFLQYWVDESQGAAFCLSRAPNKEALIATHREAHGMIPDEVYEVVQGT